MPSNVLGYHASKRAPALKCRREIPSYRLEIQSDGRKILVENDEKINIYDRIQAKKPTSTTKEIYERCVRTGDMSALNVVKAQYGDFTSATGSLIDMQRTLQKARDTFENAPLEVRSKYDHDINKFLAAVDSGQIMTDFGQKRAPAQPQPVPAQPQPAPAQPQPIPAQPQPVPAQPQPAPAQPQPAPAQYNHGGINYGY